MTTHDKEQLIRLGGQPVSGQMYTQSGSVFALIDSYDDATKSYTVVTEGSKKNPANGGGQKITGVARKTLSPGDNASLPPNTNVIVNFDLGIPIIDGLIPASARRDVVEGAPDIAPRVAGLEPEGTGASFGSPSGYYRNPSDPIGLFAGDWCQATEDGNFLAVLRGKLTKLFGGAQAQIMASGLHNLIRTVCENCDHFSSIGELRIANVNGRANLSFRAAADQMQEAGGDLENWTFHLDIGDAGKLFNMRVTSADGRVEQAQFKITPDGEVRFFGKTGFVFQTGGRWSETIGGDRVSRIDGANVKYVGRYDSTSIDGDRGASIAGSESKMVGVDETTTVNRDKMTSVGGQLSVTVSGGSVADATPANRAVEMKVLNGSYVITIGDIVAGGSPTAFASYRLYVHNGHIIIGEDPLNLASFLGGVCSVNLNTMGEGSIGLGCIVPAAGAYEDKDSATQFNTPTDSAMLYNKWLLFAEALIGALDSHTHQTAWGPSLPAEVPTGTVKGFDAILSALLTPVKSLRVRMGA
ncbi:MAG: hypothetical protein DRP01_06130 [Archaeoglobales archaeon]|nr:MAG: hypothetical protein DRP01_06130 [Archaeoglobales archaeon]